MSELGIDMNDRSLGAERRGGQVTPVIGLALALIATSAALALLGQEQARPLILALLALLSVVGVFSLFALSIGLMRFGEGARDDLTPNVLDAIDTGALVTDKAGRILLANDAYLSLTGANGHDVPSVERVFSGTGQSAEQVHRLAQAAATGEPHHEDIALDRDGVGRLFFRVDVAPLQAKGKKRGNSLWQIRDVTHDRRRQERTFVELQSAIDDLDHAPVGFVSIDREGGVRSMNATLAQWLGRDLSETLGGDVSANALVAGGVTHLLKAPDANAESRTTTQMLDVDLIRADGRVMPVRLLHKVTVSTAGEVLPSRTVVMDRGRGSGDTEPLRAAEVRFARFFNNTPLGIATLDKSGTIGRTNATFMRILPEISSANSRTTIPDLVSDTSEEELDAVIARCLEGHADISPVDVHPTEDTDRTIRLFLSPVQDRDDEAAIVYALDVTEQKALEQQIVQGSKLQAVGQLAAGIAHDFNNILTGIIGFSDILVSQHQPTDPSYSSIVQIKQNAHRAASLVRQLMAFSRQQTLRPKTLYLNDMLGDLAVLLRRLLEAGIEIRAERGRDLWAVKADLTQLEQVIINLAVNARDAMPDGGRLTISTANVAEQEARSLDNALLPPADYVRIQVADTGTGIPEEIREKIFDPFFSTKDVGKGTGLGLSTVYGIIKQTGGYVFVDSETGQGTTFSIYLPRHIEAEITTPATDATAPAQPAKDLTGDGTVLLVEDEFSIRTFATQALKARGYTVLAAETGAEALELIDAHDGEVDVVVSDVVMPEMDGPTLLKELRKRTPDIKILFMSGYAEDAFKKNLDPDATFDFLPKPFNLPELAEAVKRLMDGEGG
ncbi:MAG: response regulator [Pseudomonadota bacterium]